MPHRDLGLPRPMFFSIWVIPGPRSIGFCWAAPWSPVARPRSWMACWIKIHGFYGRELGKWCWFVVQCAHLEKWWSESQWEGWHPIYEMENKKCLKPPTRMEKVVEHRWFEAGTSELSDFVGRIVEMWTSQTSSEMQSFWLWKTTDSQSLGR